MSNPGSSKNSNPPSNEPSHLGDWGKDVLGTFEGVRALDEFLEDPAHGESVRLIRRAGQIARARRLGSPRPWMTTALGDANIDVRSQDERKGEQ